MLRTALVSLLTLFVVVPAPASAQPLAERVPADAIAYVGWAGADSMGPGFEGSHLKAMIEASELARLVSEVLPQLAARAGDLGGRPPVPAEALSGVLRPMWRHPTALYVGPVDLTDLDRPQPRFALICDAGEEAGALRRQLEQLVQEVAENAPVPVTVRAEGNVVALVVGRSPELEARLAGKGNARSIRAVTSFAAAMAMQKSPVLVGYVDAEAIVGLVNDVAERGGDEQMKQQWPAARDALGLAGLKRVSFAAGFDGKDWATHAFIEAPAPRQGLLAMLEAEPVSDGVLGAIPSTATMAGVARVDLGGVFDAVRHAFQQFDPRAAKEMDEGVRHLNGALSLDFRRDVLAPLGDEWAYYIAPEVTGRGPLGMVLVNRLRDAEKAQAASDKLRDFANDAIGQQLPPPVKVSFKQAKVGDLTVHYLATPLVTPSWVIRDGNLYVGLYPQTVAAGAGHVAREGTSILENEGFTSLRKRLGGQKATSYQFYDLPRSAPTNYQFWMLASSFGKAGDLLGVDTPLMLLPPLSTLSEHLSVAGSVTWVDNAGWHFRGVTPFPGGTVLASETGGAMDVQTSAILASVLLPSVTRAREQANRVKSASNLRQIGQAMQIYANENNGAFPPDMAGTMADLVPEVYVSPRTGTSVPRGLEGEALKKWVNESSDYVYVGGGKNVQAGAAVVVAYEKPDKLTDGINILYADGHVEFVEMGRARQIIEAGRHVDPPGAEGL